MGSHARMKLLVLAVVVCGLAIAHAEGARSAIYQFQIDNNNVKSKPTSPVEFTAEISPDMDVENAYFFNEKSQSKPGTPAQKGNCKVGQRSPQSQSQIRKKFPGARITFPKLVRCNINSIHDFVTVYVHAKAAKHVKEIPMDDMIKASYSQNNELKESVEVPLVDPNHKNEDFP